MKREKMTKSYLESIGIISVDQGSDGEWVVTKRGATRSGGVRTVQIKPRENNGTLSIYMMVDGKTKVLSLARLVYAWHLGDVLPNEEVCFINGNPMDVHFWNLVKMDQKKAFAYRRRTEEEILAELGPDADLVYDYIKKPRKE